MDEITLKRGTWHRFLARQSDSFPYWQNEMDICAYVGWVLRGTVAGLFTLAKVAIVVAFLLSLGGVTLYGAYQVVFLPESFWELLNSSRGFAGFAVAILLAVLATAAIIGICITSFTLSNYARRLKARRIDSKPGFLKLAYQSWRGKYCFKVKFVNEDQE